MARKKEEEEEVIHINYYVNRTIKINHLPLVILYILVLFLLACVACEILFVCSASIFFFFPLSVIHSFITHSVTFLLFVFFMLWRVLLFIFLNSLLVELIRLREKEKVNNNNNNNNKIRNTCKILKNSYAYLTHRSILRHRINFHPPHLFLSSTSNYRIRMDRISLFNPLFFLFNTLRQCYPTVVHS